MRLVGARVFVVIAALTVGLIPQSGAASHDRLLLLGQGDLSISIDQKPVFQQPCWNVDSNDVVSFHVRYSPGLFDFIIQSVLASTRPIGLGDVPEQLPLLDLETADTEVVVTLDYEAYDENFNPIMATGVEVARIPLRVDRGGETQDLVSGWSGPSTPKPRFDPNLSGTIHLTVDASNRFRERSESNNTASTACFILG